MSKRIDIAGEIFGDILVLEYEKQVNTHALWKCLCMRCNKITYKTYSNLVSGNSKSCKSCGQKKLSNGQEQDIIFALKNGVTEAELAKQYSVSRTIIRRIREEEIKND